MDGLTRRARGQNTRRRTCDTKHTPSSLERERHTPPSASAGRRRHSALLAGGETSFHRAAQKPQKARSASQPRAGNHSFTRDVIGRGLGRTALLRRSAKFTCVGRGPLPLLNEPPGQQGRRALRDPLVQQPGHVRAEIGRVVQPGKLITAERENARRMQEAPGGFRRGRAHGVSLKGIRNGTRLVIPVKYYAGVLPCA